MQYIFKSLSLCYHLEEFGAESAAKYIIQHHQDTNTVLFLDYLWECLHGRMADKTDYFLYNLCKLTELLKIARPTWKIFLLANISLQHKNKELAAAQFDDILYIDYFVYRTVKEIIFEKKSPVIYRWPKHSDKFLFLTGKIARANRIRLLYKFANANILDRCNWSLLFANNDIELLQAKLLLPELSSTEFSNFLHQYHRRLDNAVNIKHNSIKAIGNGYFYSNDAVVYDASIYTNACFSVISESHFASTNTPFITEKTYKAILNKHPFIIAGDTNSLNHLNSFGFVTFENFLPVRDYDIILDPERRLDAVVTNTKSFMDIIKINSDDIEDCVAHNYANLLKIYQSIEQQIQNFINKHCLELGDKPLVRSKCQSELDEDALEPLIPITVTVQKRKDTVFCDFYNSIKDDTWPECHRESDYNQLSDSIRKEMRNIFGYVEQ